MRFLYGNKNLLRVLDEADFWKQQESEHTIVIEKIVPNLEQQYVQGLNDFRLKFSKAQAQSVQLIETTIRSKGDVKEEFKKQINDYIYYAIKQSQDFIGFLNKLKANSNAVKGNVIATTVIDHIIRESEYFIGITQTVLYK